MPSPLASPVLGEPAQLRALRRIAATTLGHQRLVELDDATAAAVLHLLTIWTKVLAAERRAGFVSTCTRNTTRDLSRAARRVRRHRAPLAAARDLAPLPDLHGWAPQELRLMLADAQRAVARAAAMQPCAELAEAAACIDAMLRGVGLDDPTDDSHRRRRDRALERLRRLLDQA